MDSVRIRLGDYDGTLYSDALLRTSLVASVKFLQKRWKSKYQIVNSNTYIGNIGEETPPAGMAAASTIEGVGYIPAGLNVNDAFRNPFITFTQSYPPVLEQNDEDAIVLATAYMVHLAKLTSTSSTFVSWSTEDIRFTNTAASASMKVVLETLLQELNVLFATRIATPVVSRLPLNIITGTKVY